MGNSSSGRHGGNPCTDKMNELDVRQLARAGRLSPGQFFGWGWTRRGRKVASVDIQSCAGHVILSYRTRSSNADWQEMNYPVRLTWTPCNYGGERAWWICPVAGCGRRVAILFGGSRYACRQCHRLAYRSQRENEEDRALRRANRLRQALGWVPGIAHDDGNKPKGMHWKTYNRLRMAYYAQSARALAAMAVSLGLATTRLSSISPIKDCF